MLFEREHSMLIDLSCPAEVFQAALPTEEIPAVNLALYNLGDRVIVSAEVTLRLLNGSGVEKEHVIYRARALNGRPHSTFRMNIPCPPCPSAYRADVTIDKIWFNDNEVWQRDPASSVEYTPNDLPVSKALTDLKYAAGEAAVGYPSQQDGLWVCICGRPNPDGQDICARCRRQKDMIFSRYNRDAVEIQVSQREKQLDLFTRNVREDTARMQRIREEEYRQEQTRRNRRKRLLLCLPLCAAIVAALLAVGYPGLRLLAAKQAMDRKDWRSAAATLKELGTFGRADEKLAECGWQEAKALAAAAETPDELEAAAAALRAVTGHPESLEMADEADLTRARLALEAKDINAAYDALSDLPEDDQRRTAFENEILFTEGKMAMAAGEYADAREIFLALTDVFVPEAAEMAAECVYIPASALIDEGRYEEAIEEMNRIPEHPQSRMAILECHYRMGEDALANKDLETAAAEFLMAADYGDAKAKMTDTVYTLAEQALAAGDTAGAQALFASLPGYAPAEERNLECILLLAKEALDSHEYDRAAELLEALPEGYGDAGELITKAAYLAGSTALKNKEYEKALPLLERAGDYKDTKAKLQEILEHLAEAKLDAGDAEGALALIKQITNRKAYNKLVKKAEYLDAVTKAEAGWDPAALRARFEALGSYEDAKTWVKRMYYVEAQQAAERGEPLEAARLYELAGTWSDAAEKAAAQYDAYYGERAASARQAMEDGNYALAVSLLETIDRDSLPAAYADLAELFETACLQAGEELYLAGHPYEAARYFRLADNPRKTQRWLSNACYRIIGTWTDKDGNTAAEFREDSTCTIAGESFTFLVSDSYTLKTEENGSMVSTFRITNLTDAELSIRDMREGHETAYQLHRQSWTPSASPAEEEGEPAGSENENDSQDFSVRDSE